MSVVSGVPDDRHSPALCDLSTVRNHNRQHFNYIDLPSHAAHNVLKGALLINHTSILFKRFNPDNIMHVLHDDLLPLFYTLMMHTGEHQYNAQSTFDVQLVMMEGWNPGQYVELYQLFTAYKPLFLKDIHSAKRAVCFQHVHVGLSKHTTWYQYGFHEPQGPLPNTQVSATEIHQFTDFVKARYGLQEQHNIKEMTADDDATVVIFVRRYNRLILNEVELTTAIAQRLKMKVVTLSMETHSVEHIISVLSRTTVLLSMHGSLLSLAMFLPPGAILVELFPYAINPSHYTPYKTLAELAGMGILHKAWRNSHKDNTVTHPNRAWDTGGIAHLSLEEQERIITSSEVALHLCCRDPEWLFRIYQDTVVDVVEVISIIQGLLKEREMKLNSLVEEEHALVCDRVYPSNVQNITCVTPNDDKSQQSPSLLVKWATPWNLVYLDVENVEYEVWLQESGQSEYSAWIMSKTQHLFDSGLKAGTEYNVWIRCLLDSNIVGPFNSENIACIPRA